MNKQVYMPVRLIAGKDCVRECASTFAAFGKRCLLVTGRNAARESGALADVEAALEAGGVAWTVYNDIRQNPLVSSVVEAGEQARRAGAEFIVGIGGGSALDAAKAVAICACHPDFGAAELYGRKIPTSALPVLLVGTTAGTGSEVTGVSVLTNDADGRKKSISGADCYAAVSFLDPRYTYSVGYDGTVSTALDAFAHATESFFSPKRGVLTDSACRRALPALWRALRTFAETHALPDEAGRDALYFASIDAGLGINSTGTGFPHTVGYLLTEHCGVPHGKACTALYDSYLPRAQRFAPDRFCEYAALFDADVDGVRRVIRELTDVTLTASPDEIAAWCARFDGPVRNFDNSPGGYDRAQAEADLNALRA